METKEKKQTEGLYKEMERIAKKSLLKKKIIGISVIAIIVCVSLVVCLCAAWVSGKKSAAAELADMQAELDERDRKIEELQNTPAVVESITPEIVIDEIYSEIANIGELASSEYIFTYAARYSHTREDVPIIKGWTEKTFTLRWNGVIKAGIDLSNVELKVSEEEKKIFVVLPAAKVLSYSIDYDNIEVLDEKDGLFNRVTIEDQNSFYASTQEEIVERAINNGLLEKAQANAEAVITQILTMNPAISTDYTIVFVVVNN